MNTTPKSRLRWYQYSLRSLLVLTLLVALGGSWFAVKRQQAESQRAAVKAVRESGGFVAYDYEWDESGNWIANAQPWGPAWLRRWLGDDFFADVVAAHVENDAELEYLKGFRRFRALTSSGWKITDSGSPVTVEFLESRITDAGLQRLGELSQLQRLDLNGSQITDAGLPHLNGLTHLKALDLSYTKVTDEGIKKLKQALPNCEIYH